jgi:PadR family transcriptional regulator PadR
LADGTLSVSLDDPRMVGIRAMDEELNFGEGLIYPLLHSLEDGGLLATRREKVNGRPRVYYRLTASGKKRLKETSDDWRRVAQAVRKVLSGGGDHAQPTIS